MEEKLNITKKYSSKISKFSKNEESIAKYVSLFCLLFIVFIITMTILATNDSKCNESKNKNDKENGLYKSISDVIQTGESAPIEDKNEVSSISLKRCIACNDYCTLDNNHLICNYITTEEFNNYLQNKNFSLQNDYLDICLNDIKFLNNRLDQFWYNHSLNLRSIKITSSHIEQINPNAFCDKPLSAIERLELLDINVSEFHYHLFKDLHKLNELIINNIAKSFKAKGFLQTVATTLEKLTYIGTKDSAVIDPKHYFTCIFTEYQYKFEKLEYIKFENNNFGNVLNKDSFLQTPKIKELILSNNQITDFTKGTFESIFDTLEFLDLSQNHLTTLPENFVYTKFNNKMPFQLDLSRNFLSCDCNLKNFAKIYEKFQSNFVNKIYCSSPFELAGHLLDTNKLCLNSCSTNNNNSNGAFQNPEIWIGFGILIGVGCGLSCILCCIKWKPKILNRTLFRRSKHKLIVSKKKLSDASTQSLCLSHNDAWINEKQRKTMINLISDNYILPNFYEAIDYKANDDENNLEIFTESFPADAPPPPLPKRCSDQITIKTDEIEDSTSQIFFVQNDTHI